MRAAGATIKDGLHQPLDFCDAFDFFYIAFNARRADVGHAQLTAAGELEPPLVTSGDDLMQISRFLNGRTSYRARDVIDYLLATEASNGC